MEKTGVRERDKLENRANAAAGAWLSTPVIPALHKAKARGLQAGAQSGQFSNFKRPCLKIINKKGLGMQLKVGTRGSIPGTTKNTQK